jgi:hypothetical protein
VGFGDSIRKSLINGSPKAKISLRLIKNQRQRPFLNLGRSICLRGKKVNDEVMITESSIKLD